MTASLRVDEWIQCIDTEYLRSFLKDGGASVKFAVALDADAARESAEKLASAAARSDYLVAMVDAGTTRVHMIEQLFFRVAQQMRWHALALNVTKTLAGKLAYRWPASPNDGSWYEALAKQNGTDQVIVRNEIRQELTRAVYYNTSLAKDFRVAMLQICQATLAGGDEGKTTVDRLTDWLTGRNRAVSAVKSYHVFTPINRSNARHHLESLCRWVRFAGHTGLTGC